MNAPENMNFLPRCKMQFYVEPDNPDRDLGGLCECFVSRTEGERTVAHAHVHRCFELLYCLEGSYELMIERRTFALNQGDVALIHPMEPHQTRTLEKSVSSYLVLKFTPEALYSVNQPVYEMKYMFPYLHFSGQHSYVYTKEQLEGSRMGELLACILQERQGETYGYEMAVRAYIGQVLLWFIRAWHRQGESDAIDDRTLFRLRAALSYIEEHLDEEISCGDVAAHLDMGVSTFSRFFAKAAGDSFPAYVRAMRLSRATALLVDSDKSITEIALETGFSTASYFILCFRKKYKMTPAQFRGLYTSGGKTIPSRNQS